MVHELCSNACLVPSLVLPAVVRHPTLQVSSKHSYGSLSLTGHAPSLVLVHHPDRNQNSLSMPDRPPVLYSSLHGSPTPLTPSWRTPDQQSRPEECRCRGECFATCLMATTYSEAVTLYPFQTVAADQARALHSACATPLSCLYLT